MVKSVTQQSSFLYLQRKAHGLPPRRSSLPPSTLPPPTAAGRLVPTPQDSTQISPTPTGPLRSQSPPPPQERGLLHPPTPSLNTPTSAPSRGAPERPPGRRQRLRNRNPRRRAAEASRTSPPGRGVARLARSTPNPGTASPAETRSPFRPRPRGRAAQDLHPPSL